MFRASASDLAVYRRMEGLPEAFDLTVARVCEPLAKRAQLLRATAGRSVIVGVCGAQGSGKSTITAVTSLLLNGAGLRTVVLSLDDVYLDHEARQSLAEDIHPLLTVRGPPGTHDVALANTILDNLTRAGPTPLPRFDKATDTRVQAWEWQEVEGPLDVVLFEGWCVGARAQAAVDLLPPINALEATQDIDGGWRRYVNRQLAGTYQELFRRLDALVLLAAPGFNVVQAWRTEQERKLRERTGKGMSDAKVAEFIQHYERITRWILEEMPSRADWVIPLGRDRTPLV